MSLQNRDKIAYTEYYSCCQWGRTKILSLLHQHADGSIKYTWLQTSISYFNILTEVRCRIPSSAIKIVVPFYYRNVEEAAMKTSFGFPQSISFFCSVAALHLIPYLQVVSDVFKPPIVLEVPRSRSWTLKYCAHFLAWKMHNQFFFRMLKTYHHLLWWDCLCHYWPQQLYKFEIH